MRPAVFQLTIGGMSSKHKIHTSSRVRSSPQFSVASRVERKEPEAAPGPGKYGSPGLEQTRVRALSYGFGSSVRDSNKSFKDKPAIPGPGSYTPYDPNAFIQKTVFGSGSRLPVKKPSGVPPPGTYPKDSTLVKRDITMLGRYAGKQASTSPAPGHYTPSFNQVYEEKLRPHMDTKEDRSKAETFKSKTWRSSAPDPGRYNQLPELGAHKVMSKSAPSFSFGARRRPHNTDASPGPITTDYSAFH